MSETITLSDALTRTEAVFDKWLMQCRDGSYFTHADAHADGLRLHAMLREAFQPAPGETGATQNAASECSYIQGVPCAEGTKTQPTSPPARTAGTTPSGCADGAASASAGSAPQGITSRTTTLTGSTKTSSPVGEDDSALQPSESFLDALCFNAERDIMRCDNRHSDKLADVGYCGKCGWAVPLFHVIRALQGVLLIQKLNQPQPASVEPQWRCDVRRHPTDPPQDCDWPTCGCDPHANRVIEALEESGRLD